jgi:hypothetical protein
MMRMSGTERGKVTRGWGDSHNDELHKLRSLPYVREIRSRWMRLSGDVACIGGKGSAYRALIVKSAFLEIWD